MRRNRTTTAPSNALAVASPGLRLCGSFEPAGKNRGSLPSVGSMSFVDSDQGEAVIGSAESLEPAVDAIGAERTVLVNLAPYLIGDSHRHARHPHAGTAGLMAEIDTVLGAMQDSLDSLNDDVNSLKFPDAEAFSGPSRPAA